MIAPDFGTAILYIGPFALLTLAAALNLKIWTGHFIKIGDAVLDTKPFERIVRISPKTVTIMTTVYVLATIAMVTILVVY